VVLDYILGWNKHGVRYERDNNCNSGNFGSHFTLGFDLFKVPTRGLKRWQVFKNDQLQVRNSGKKRGAPRGALAVLDSYTFLLYFVTFSRTLDALIMRKRSLFCGGFWQWKSVAIQRRFCSFNSVKNIGRLITDFQENARKRLQILKSKYLTEKADRANTKNCFAYLQNSRLCILFRRHHDYVTK